MKSEKVVSKARSGNVLAVVVAILGVIFAVSLYFG